jgi:hypothetical protein
MHLCAQPMESAASNWKSLRNGVIVSVVVLYMVEPAMKVAVDIIPSFGGRFYRLVWDRAATQAAIGGNYLDFAMFAILFSAIVGAFIGRFGAGAVFPRLFGRRGRKSTDSTWVRWEKRFVVLMMLLIGPIAATTLLVDFAAQQMKLSFDRRITVLAPAITEDSEELLRARFADLAGRGDYQTLNDEMDRLAREASVALPDPLL